IADEGNHRYDSAIFLGGGSFNFGVNIGEDRLIANGNPVCSNETVILDATSNGATAYQWFFNDTPLIGETNATLTLSPPFDSINQEGNYYANISFGATCTTNSSSLQIEFAPELTVYQSVFETCDLLVEQDGISSFNLDDIITEIFQNIHTNYQINFFDNPNNTTPLPINYINTTANLETIYVKISNITECYPTYTIQLQVNSFSQDVSNVTLGLCDGNTIQLNAGSGFSSYLWNTNETSQT